MDSLDIYTTTAFRKQQAELESLKKQREADEDLLRRCVNELKSAEKEFTRASEGAILTGTGPVIRAIESRLGGGSK